MNYRLVAALVSRLRKVLIFLIHDVTINRLQLLQLHLIISSLASLITLHHLLHVSSYLSRTLVAQRAALMV